MDQEKFNGGCPYSQIQHATEDIFGTIRKKFRKLYGDNKPLRIFHAKAIGLVKATFSIDPNLQDHLKAGLFKQAGTYDAWVRFSNGSPTITPDKAKGLRGMAIKVLGVPGDRYLDDDAEGKTQDFVLLNSPTFFPGIRVLQPSGVRFVLGKPLVQASQLLYIIRFSVSGIIDFISKALTTPPNVLTQSFYSTTPYAFGNDRVVKWHVKPEESNRDTMPQQPSENFLRDRLKRDLAAGSVRFGIYVQFHENQKKEPIDNSAITWHTPFHRVATLTLRQHDDFDTVERWKKDENISFSPWHGLYEHKPLGGVNNVRRRVYGELAKERLHFNDANIYENV